MNPLIQGALLSLLPFTELRLSIPLTIANGGNPLSTFLVCTFANILVIPLVFIFLNYIHSKIIHINSYSKLFNRLLRRIRPKSEKIKGKIELIGLPALTLFVAIPLPVTGAYTGTVIAWLLGLNSKKSFLAIASGVLIAGIIVTALSSGIILAFNSF